MAYDPDSRLLTVKEKWESAVLTIKWRGEGLTHDERDRYEQLAAIDIANHRGNRGR